ncbi:MAG TPA: ABC transporter permease [Acidimicrobiales bacterium]|nr:ABC transporter permease [Acidimicrobiales bacterium]
MDRYLPRDPRLRAALLVVGGFVLLGIVTQFVMPGSTGGSRGTPAAILFTGLCSGLVSALPACGMILIYRTLRVINFTQTALGVGGAVLTFNFIQYTPVPFPIAFLLGLVLSTLVGVVVGIVGLRFFKSSRLFYTVITIILAQLLSGLSGQFANLPFFPPQDQRTSSDQALAQNIDRLLPLQGFTFNVGDLDIRFGFAEIFSIEVAIVALVGLALFLRYTRSGVAVRALAENSERASLLGIGVGKLSILVWGLAGLLSGIGVTLNGAITIPANATTVDLTVLLSVLTAAVLAAFVNIPVAVGASVGLGILEQSFTFSYKNDEDLFNVVLFLLIAAGLLFQRRKGRSERAELTSWAGAEESRPIPKELAGISTVVWARRGLIAVGVIALVVFPFVVSTGRIVLAGVIALNAIGVMSLVVLTGWAGQVSLGQYGFITIGAVVGGALTSRANIPFWFAVPAATAVTAAVAVLVGIPALRIKGLFLLVATFGFATAVQTTIFNDKYFDWLLPDAVDRPTFFFLNFEDEKSMYFLCVASFFLAIVVVNNLRKSRTGRTLIALRENEPNVQSFGINALRTKLVAFAISGGMAGFAGAILAHHQRGITADTFPLRRNLELFVQAVFGGVSSVGGALLGSAFFQISNDLIDSQLVFILFNSSFPFLILIAYPGGLISMVMAGRDSVLRIIAQRRQIVVPSLFADYDATALERRLIPLGDPLTNSGLAALPTNERFVMESDLYQGKGERIIDKLGPTRESDETVAIGAAARSMADEGEL